MTSHGQFHWNELMSRDVERDKRFYHDTVGWTFEAMPMSDGRTYWVANMGGRPVAGIFPLDTPEFEDVQPGWMPYLAVDDVDARAAKAVSAGAQFMRPIFDVPQFGRITILREPGGAGIGWMTPVPM
ncbi:MAG: VOC family protein [Pseudorhodoplanes sp.]|jgi:predicted enzyme related to lactoylglutathione lyase|nr:VOC family protein [Pseudorhodoplanes sp.]